MNSKEEKSEQPKSPDDTKPEDRSPDVGPVQNSESTAEDRAEKETTATEKEKVEETVVKPSMEQLLENMNAEFSIERAKNAELDLYELDSQAEDYLDELLEDEIPDLSTFHDDFLKQHEYELAEKEFSAEIEKLTDPYTEASLAKLDEIYAEILKKIPNPSIPLRFMYFEKKTDIEEELARAKEALAEEQEKKKEIDDKPETPEFDFYAKQQLQDDNRRQNDAFLRWSDGEFSADSEEDVFLEDFTFTDSDDDVELKMMPQRKSLHLNLEEEKEFAKQLEKMPEYMELPEATEKGLLAPPTREFHIPGGRKWKASFSFPDDSVYPVVQSVEKGGLFAELGIEAQARIACVNDIDVSENTKAEVRSLLALQDVTRIEVLVEQPAEKEWDPTEGMTLKEMTSFLRLQKEQVFVARRTFDTKCIPSEHVEKGMELVIEEWSDTDDLVLCDAVEFETVQWLTYPELWNLLPKELVVKKEAENQVKKEPNDEGLAILNYDDLFVFEGENKGKLKSAPEKAEPEEPPKPAGAEEGDAGLVDKPEKPEEEAPAEDKDAGPAEEAAETGDKGDAETDPEAAKRKPNIKVEEPEASEEEQERKEAEAPKKEPVLTENDEVKMPKAEEKEPVEKEDTKEKAKDDQPEPSKEVEEEAEEKVLVDPVPLALLSKVPTLLWFGTKKGFNHTMTGVYEVGGTLHEGKVFYKNKQEKFVIRWHSESKKWLLDWRGLESDRTCCGYVDDEEGASLHPGMVTEVWHIFDKPGRKDADGEWLYMKGVKACPYEYPKYLRITGRKGYNDAMNGVYVRGDNIHEGRIFYRIMGGGRHDFVLRWNPLERKWLCDWRGLNTDKTCSGYLAEDMPHPGVEGEAKWKIYDGTIRQWVFDSAIKCQVYEYPERIIASGRTGYNDGLNGVYELGDTLHDNNIFYKHIGRDFVIRWLSEQGKWLIDWRGLNTDLVCSAVVRDNAPHPAEIKGKWRVYDGSRWKMDARVKVELLEEVNPWKGGFQNLGEANLWLPELPPPGGQEMDEKRVDFVDHYCESYANPDLDRVPEPTRKELFGYKIAYALSAKRHMVRAPDGSNQLVELEALEDPLPEAEEKSIFGFLVKDLWSLYGDVGDLVTMFHLQRPGVEKKFEEVVGENGVMKKMEVLQVQIVFKNNRNKTDYASSFLEGGYAKSSKFASESQKKMELSAKDAKKGVWAESTRDELLEQRKEYEKKVEELKKKEEEYKEDDERDPSEGYFDVPPVYPKIPALPQLVDQGTLERFKSLHENAPPTQNNVYLDKSLFCLVIKVMDDDPTCFESVFNWKDLGRSRFRCRLAGLKVEPEKRWKFSKLLKELYVGRACQAFILDIDEEAGEVIVVLASPHRDQNFRRHEYEYLGHMAILRELATFHWKIQDENDLGQVGQAEKRQSFNRRSYMANNVDLNENWNRDWIREYRIAQEAVNREGPSHWVCTACGQVWRPDVSKNKCLYCGRKKKNQKFLRLLFTKDTRAKEEEFQEEEEVHNAVYKPNMQEDFSQSSGLIEEEHVISVSNIPVESYILSKLNHKMYKAKEVRKGKSSPATIILHTLITIAVFGDFGTDLIVLDRFATLRLMAPSVLSFVFILSPYAISYSSGVQLLLLNRYFAEYDWKKKIGLALFLLPFGLLYFFIADIMNIVFTLFIALPFCIIKRTDHRDPDLIDIKSRFFGLIYLTPVQVAGYERQRAIAGNTFETIPQIMLQVALYLGIFGEDAVEEVGFEYLLISAGFALFSIYIQMVIIRRESKALLEDGLEYGMICMNGRFGWVPYLNAIIDNRCTKSKLTFDNLVIHVREGSNLKVYMDYYFDDESMRQFIDKLLYFDKKLNIVLDFGISCNFVSLHSMLQLIIASHEKSEIDLTGVNWQRCIGVSVKQGLPLGSTSGERSMLHEILTYAPAEVRDDMVLHVLHYCHQNGNKLKSSASDMINEIDSQTTLTILMRCINSNLRELAQKLLDLKEVIGLDVDKAGVRHNPLSLAIALEHRYFVKLLVSHGANRMYEISDGRNPFTVLLELQKFHLLDPLEVDVGNVNDQISDSLTEALFDLVENREFEKFRRVEKRFFGSETFKDSNGNTLLHLLALNYPKDHDKLNALFEAIDAEYKRRDDDQVKNNDGLVPIEIAVNMGSVGFVRNYCKQFREKFDCDPHRPAWMFGENVLLPDPKHIAFIWPQTEVKVKVSAEGKFSNKLSITYEVATYRDGTLGKRDGDPIVRQYGGVLGDFLGCKDFDSEQTHVGMGINVFVLDYYGNFVKSMVFDETTPGELEQFLSDVNCATHITVAASCGDIQHVQTADALLLEHKFGIPFSKKSAVGCFVMVNEKNDISEDQTCFLEFSSYVTGRRDLHAKESKHVICLEHQHKRNRCWHWLGSTHNYIFIDTVGHQVLVNNHREHRIEGGFLKNLDVDRLANLMSTGKKGAEYTGVMTWLGRGLKKIKIHPLPIYVRRIDVYRDKEAFICGLLLWYSNDTKTLRGRIHPAYPEPVVCDVTNGHNEYFKRIGVEKAEVKEELPVSEVSKAKIENWNMCMKRVIFETSRGRTFIVPSTLSEIEAAETDGEEADEAENEWEIGSRLYVLGKRSGLRRACTIKQVKKKQILVHFVGFAAEYDEVLSKASSRISHNEEDMTNENRKRDAVENDYESDLDDDEESMKSFEEEKVEEEAVTGQTETDDNVPVDSALKLYEAPEPVLAEDLETFADMMNNMPEVDLIDKMRLDVKNPEERYEELKGWRRQHDFWAKAKLGESDMLQILKARAEVDESATLHLDLEQDISESEIALYKFKKNVGLMDKNYTRNSLVVLKHYFDNIENPDGEIRSFYEEKEQEIQDHLKKKEAAQVEVQEYGMADASMQGERQDVNRILDRGAWEGGLKRRDDPRAEENGMIPLGEPVEEKPEVSPGEEVPESLKEKVPEFIKVSGKIGYNAAMNGIYKVGKFLHEGKVYYQHTSKEEDFVIRWHSTALKWLIDWRGLNNDKTCSGYCVDDDNKYLHPAMFKGTWRIFDKTWKGLPEVKVEEIKNLQESKEEPQNSKAESNAEDEQKKGAQSAALLEQAPPCVKISGKVGYNAAMNGIYSLGNHLHEGRVFYHHQTDDRFVIRWHPEKMWIIDWRRQLHTDKTCSAYVKADCAHPGLVTSAWKVYEKGSGWRFIPEIKCTAFSPKESKGETGEVAEKVESTSKESTEQAAEKATTGEDETGKGTTDDPPEAQKDASAGEGAGQEETASKGDPTKSSGTDSQVSQSQNVEEKDAKPGDAGETQTEMIDDSSEIVDPPLELGDTEDILKSLWDAGSKTKKTDEVTTEETPKKSEEELEAERKEQERKELEEKLAGAIRKFVFFVSEMEEPLKDETISKLLPSVELVATPRSIMWIRVFQLAFSDEMEANDLAAAEKRVGRIEAALKEAGVTADLDKLSNEKLGQRIQDMEVLMGAPEKEKEWELETLQEDLKGLLKDFEMIFNGHSGEQRLKDEDVLALLPERGPMYVKFFEAICKGEGTTESYFELIGVPEDISTLDREAVVQLVSEIQKLIHLDGCRYLLEFDAFFENFKSVLQACTPDTRHGVKETQEILIMQEEELDVWLTAVCGPNGPDREFLKGQLFYIPAWSRTLSRERNYLPYGNHYDGERASRLLNAHRRALQNQYMSKWNQKRIERLDVQWYEEENAANHMIMDVTLNSLERPCVTAVTCVEARRPFNKKGKKAAAKMFRAGEERAEEAVEDAHMAEIARELHKKMDVQLDKVDFQRCEVNRDDISPDSVQFAPPIPEAVRISNLPVSDEHGDPNGLYLLSDELHRERHYWTLKFSQDDLKVGNLKKASQTITFRWDERKFRWIIISQNVTGSHYIFAYLDADVKNPSVITGKRWKSPNEKSAKKGGVLDVKIEVMDDEPTYWWDRHKKWIEESCKFDLPKKEKPKKKKYNYFEALCRIFTEVVSGLDLVTDAIIISKMWQHNHVSWTTLSVACVLGPYLIAFSSLNNFFLYRRVFQGSATRSVLGVLFLSPLCLIYFFVMDITFMLQTIVNDVVAILMFREYESEKDFSDSFFMSIGLTLMDIKGYRRQRTLSQLTFESLPQIALQFYILQQKEAKEIGITGGEVQLSIAFALMHLVFESIVLYLEAKAARMPALHYFVLCLCGRFGWCPYDHLLRDNRQDKLGNVLDYSDMSFQSCITVTLSYEFSRSTLRKLTEIIGFLKQDVKKFPQYIIIISGENIKKCDLADICKLMAVCKGRVELLFTDVQWGEIIKAHTSKRADLNRDIWRFGAAEQHILAHAVEYENYELLVACLENGCDPNIEVNDNGQSALHLSIQLNQHGDELGENQIVKAPYVVSVDGKEVEEWILGQVIKLDDKRSNRELEIRSLKIRKKYSGFVWTGPNKPRPQPFRRGLDIVHVLLKNGATLCTAMEDGTTPLDSAVDLRANESMLQLLFQHGVEFDPGQEEKICGQIGDIVSEMDLQNPQRENIVDLIRLLRIIGSFNLRVGSEGLPLYSRLQNGDNARPEVIEKLVELPELIAVKMMGTSQVQFIPRVFLEKLTYIRKRNMWPLGIVEGNAEKPIDFNKTTLDFSVNQFKHFYVAMNAKNKHTNLESCDYVASQLGIQNGLVQYYQNTSGLAQARPTPLPRIEKSESRAFTVGFRNLVGCRPLGKLRVAEKILELKLQDDCMMVESIILSADVTYQQITSPSELPLARENGFFIVVSDEKGSRQRFTIAPVDMSLNTFKLNHFVIPSTTFPRLFERLIGGKTVELWVSSFRWRPWNLHVKTCSMDILFQTWITPIVRHEELVSTVEQTSTLNYDVLLQFPSGENARFICPPHTQISTFLNLGASALQLARGDVKWKSSKKESKNNLKDLSIKEDLSNKIDFNLIIGEEYEFQDPVRKRFEDLFGTMKNVFGAGACDFIAVFLPDAFAHAEGVLGWLNRLPNYGKVWFTHPETEVGKKQPGIHYPVRQNEFHDFMIYKAFVNTYPYVCSIFDLNTGKLVDFIAERTAKMCDESSTDVITRDGVTMAKTGVEKFYAQAIVEPLLDEMKEHEYLAILSYTPTGTGAMQQLQLFDRCYEMLKRKQCYVVELYPDYLAKGEGKHKRDQMEEESDNEEENEKDEQVDLVDQFKIGDRVLLKNVNKKYVGKAAKIIDKSGEEEWLVKIEGKRNPQKLKEKYLEHDQKKKDQELSKNSDIKERKWKKLSLPVETINAWREQAGLMTGPHMTLFSLRKGGKKELLPLHFRAENFLVFDPDCGHFPWKLEDMSFSYFLEPFILTDLSDLMYMPPTLLTIGDEEKHQFDAHVKMLTKITTEVLNVQLFPLLRLVCVPQTRLSMIRALADLYPGMIAQNKVFSNMLLILDLPGQIPVYWWGLSCIQKNYNFDIAVHSFAAEINPFRFVFALHHPKDEQKLVWLFSDGTEETMDLVFPAAGEQFVALRVGEWIPAVERSHRGVVVHLATACETRTVTFGAQPKPGDKTYRLQKAEEGYQIAGLRGSKILESPVNPMLLQGHLSVPLKYEERPQAQNMFKVCQKIFAHYGAMCPELGNILRTFQCQNAESSLINLRKSYPWSTFHLSDTFTWLQIYDLMEVKAPIPEALPKFRKVFNKQYGPFHPSIVNRARLRALSGELSGGEMQDKPVFDRIPGFNCEVERIESGEAMLASHIALLWKGSKNESQSWRNKHYLDWTNHDITSWASSTTPYGRNINFDGVRGDTLESFFQWSNAKFQSRYQRILQKEFQTMKRRHDARRDADQVKYKLCRLIANFTPPNYWLGRREGELTYFGLQMPITAKRNIVLTEIEVRALGNSRTRINVYLLNPNIPAVLAAPETQELENYLIVAEHDAVPVGKGKERRFHVPFNEGHVFIPAGETIILAVHMPENNQIKLGRDGQNHTFDDVLSAFSRERRDLFPSAETEDFIVYRGCPLEQLFPSINIPGLRQTKIGNQTVTFVGGLKYRRFYKL